MQKEIHLNILPKKDLRLKYILKKPIAISFISLSLIIASLYLDTSPLPFNTCLFKLVTDLPCPSCGLTHSFISLGHRHLKEAFFYNIMGPFLYLFTLLVLFIAFYDLFSRKNILFQLWDKFRNYILIIVIALALFSWAWNIYKRIWHFPLQTS